MTSQLKKLQAEICEKYNVKPFESASIEKVGIALNVKEGIVPINGLRHPPEGDTSGWYIWAGEEISEADDFFKPLHVEHLKDWCPLVEKYLSLPPGWRFLVAGDYEDVWFDESLLSIE